MSPRNAPMDRTDVGDSHSKSLSEIGLRRLPAQSQYLSDLLLVEFGLGASTTNGRCAVAGGIAHIFFVRRPSQMVWINARFVPFAARVGGLML